MRRRHLFSNTNYHDDVIKWKHFPRCWPFVRGIHRCPVNSLPAKRPVTRSFDIFFDLRPNKRLSKQWSGWYLRPHRAHYDVTVMYSTSSTIVTPSANLQPRENSLRELAKWNEKTMHVFRLQRRWSAMRRLGLRRRMRQQPRLHADVLQTFLCLLLSG